MLREQLGENCKQKPKNSLIEQNTESTRAEECSTVEQVKPPWDTKMARTVQPGAQKDQILEHIGHTKKDENEDFPAEDKGPP